MLYGNSRQNTVFEYLQEVQVKTGGISRPNAGGALGRVISAVTKSGGNKFVEAHYYYIGSGISAGPGAAAWLSPSDDTSFPRPGSRQKNNQNRAGGSVGGPILRNRLFFYASGFRRASSDAPATYLFSNGTDPGSSAPRRHFMQSFGKLTLTQQAAAGKRQHPVDANAVCTHLRSCDSLAGNAAQIGRRTVTTDQHCGTSLQTRRSIVRGGVSATTALYCTRAAVWNTASIGTSRSAEQPPAVGIPEHPAYADRNEDRTKTGLGES